MASGIAHNFNNALTPILGFTELLLNCPKTLDDKEKVTRYLQIMNVSAQEAASTIRRLRQFYRPPSESKTHQSVHLNSLVMHAIALTQPKWKNEAQRSGIPINIEKNLQGASPVVGNEAELCEALTNLILNAVDAMPKGGTIGLRTWSDDEYAVIEVTDTGVGMTEDVRRRCLNPFFSTRGERGSGMGLAVVYGAVQ